MGGCKYFRGLTVKNKDRVLYGLTEEQRNSSITVEDIMNLRHMLGSSRGVYRGGYRNGYCCSAIDPSMERLIKAGLVKRGHWLSDSENMTFHATEAGMVLGGITDAARKRLLQER